MQYDPVKDIIMHAISQHPWLRKIFFLFLDILFLRQWFIKSKLKKLMSKNDAFSFYDAGAGFCQYSDFILRCWKNSHVLAVDIKSDYLEDYAQFANKRFSHRFEWAVGDLVYYEPFEKFDLIAAVDILEHIENDTQVFDNFYNCLNNGGKLIISTPSDKDETARFTSEHVRPGYAESEIKSKLAASGFRITDFTFSYGIWGNLSWKLAIKFPLLMVSYSKLILLILPIYYICLYPLIFLLMFIDINIDNRTGNGIIILAEKAR